MNGRRGEEDLAVLIERSAELKRDLVDFACGPRLERSLAAAMLEAGLEEIDEGDAISTIDRFALQYRLPDGQTVVDRFVASRPDLTAADREMLLGWRDPVEGIFEIRGQDGDAIILLNLLDDLEYRTSPFSNTAGAATSVTYGPCASGTVGWWGQLSKRPISGMVRGSCRSVRAAAGLAEPARRRGCRCGGAAERP